MNVPAQLLVAQSKGIIYLTPVHSESLTEVRLPANLLLGRMVVRSESCVTAPCSPASNTHPAPADSSQTGAGFFMERVCDDFPIAHRLRRSLRGSVKERTGVPRAVGAKARNFERIAIVAYSRDWPADNRHADEIAVEYRAEAEFVPNYPPVFTP